MICYEIFFYYLMNDYDRILSQDLNIILLMKIHSKSVVCWYFAQYGKENIYTNNP